MTVSTLAKRCGLSRSTVLHYESLGLLRPPSRTAGNYRSYTETDLHRLQQITVYRNVGLGLPAIRAVLDRPRGDATTVLERRLIEIDRDIDTLRGHQRAILRLLEKSRTLGRTKMMTKDRWVAIMRSAGFSEDDMRRWHAEFEKAAPSEHQEFLQFLHIEPAEIARIREASRSAHDRA